MSRASEKCFEVTPFRVSEHALLKVAQAICASLISSQRSNAKSLLNWVVQYIRPYSCNPCLLQFDLMLFRHYDIRQKISLEFNYSVIARFWNSLHFHFIFTLLGGLPFSIVGFQGALLQKESHIKVKIQSYNITKKSTKVAQSLQREINLANKVML